MKMCCHTNNKINTYRYNTSPKSRAKISNSISKRTATIRHGLCTFSSDVLRALLDFLRALLKGLIELILRYL